MRAANLPPRRVVWGMWLFFTAAAQGFVIFLAGAFAESATAMWAGAAVTIFSFLVYLFAHFWMVTNAALAPVSIPGTPTPTPATNRIISRPVPPIGRANRQNFDHLLSHTLERVVPPEPEAIPIPQESSWPLATATATDAAGGRHEKRPFVPAAERRRAWIQELPIVRQVLSDPKPEAPARPSAPTGKTIGECSGCGAKLTAPAWRPIRIRCPHCGKSGLLEA